MLIQTKNMEKLRKTIIESFFLHFLKIKKKKGEAQNENLFFF
jgi:hypothetical protein